MKAKPSMLRQPNSDTKSAGASSGGGGVHSGSMLQQPTLVTNSSQGSGAVCAVAVTLYGHQSWKAEAWQFTVCQHCDSESPEKRLFRDFVRNSRGEHYERAERLSFDLFAAQIVHPSLEQHPSATWCWISLDYG